MKTIDEVSLFRKALEDAKEHLARWEELGKRLNRTADPTWKNILSLRKEDVKQLQELVKHAEGSS